MASHANQGTVCAILPHAATNDDLTLTREQICWTTGRRGVHDARISCGLSWRLTENWIQMVCRRSGSSLLHEVLCFGEPSVAYCTFRIHASSTHHSSKISGTPLCLHAFAYAWKVLCIIFPCKSFIIPRSRARSHCRAFRYLIDGCTCSHGSHPSVRERHEIPAHVS